MELSTVFICVAFAGVAVSYAWGMRGMIIGGEKGAMLPGLYLGLILAWFAGGGIKENFCIPAAAGLMGMSFGGTEPYGETIHMALCVDSEKYNPIKGYTGLAIKGGLWFSVAGGFIALSMSAMGGRYSAVGIVIFCVLIPVIQQIGYRLFNQPYDKEQNKFPAIYFSFGRREEWGSNLALLLVMLGMGIIKGDNLLIRLLSGGFAFGFIGWIVAMKFYKLSIYPLKNGTYIFDRYLKEGKIDGWKIMEFTLGAIGGMGVAFVFCLSGKEISEINLHISEFGVFNPLGNKDFLALLVTLASALGVAGINYYQYRIEKRGGTYDSFKWDLIERPLFCVVPMIFVLLCSNFASRIMTVFMLFLVCTVKNLADRFKKDKSIILPAVIFVFATALMLIIDLAKGGFSAYQIILAGGVPYLAAEVFYKIYSDAGETGKSVREIFSEGAYPVVMEFMLVQVSIIYLSASFIF